MKSSVIVRIVAAICLIIFLLILISSFISVRSAFAQHGPSGTSPAGQHQINHADVTITSAASAVGVCGGANAARQTAIIQNTGTNPMRVGDATTNATSGEVVVGGSGTSFDTNTEVYVYSALGTTAGCTEVSQ